MCGYALMRDLLKSAKNYDLNLQDMQQACNRQNWFTTDDMQRMLLQHQLNCAIITMGNDNVIQTVQLHT